LHESKYEGIRKAILAKSKSIVQDDSGVPFKFFDAKIWDLKFYGTYTRPIPVFNAFYQPDLMEAWKPEATSPKFRFGYNNIPSIIMASKK
jgi:hypothetical protein